MNQLEIITRMQPVFDNVFLEPPQLVPGLSAKDVPEWDSMLHISLLVALEKAFSIRFRVGEVEATANIGELADLILRRLAEK